MKKIDLHIHTKPKLGQDANFEFDLEKFVEYVSKMAIDAVAVTNHNFFDKVQFQQISNKLKNTSVFPGIEINIENGHLLLISENEKLDSFEEKCRLVLDEVENNRNLNATKLVEIFGDLNEYLLIPHYEKDPIVGQSTLTALSGFITAGEVSSPKKFNRIIKKENSLVPVYFSDIRIKKDLDVSKYQGKHTFIKNNSEKITLGSLKICLGDTNKVFLSNLENHNFFQVFTNGLQLSNGLNVVLGERSSGKTHFLEKLLQVYGLDEKNVKYIKQFELVKNDDKIFADILTKEQSNVRELFLGDFKNVIDEVLSIDNNKNEKEIEDFTESLVNFAQHESMHDSFSRSYLYRETKYNIRKDEDLESVLNATLILKDNRTQKDIINSYITENKIELMFNDLVGKYKEKKLQDLKRAWVNDVVSDIQVALQSQTATPVIKNNDIDFFNFKLNEYKINKFNLIANALKNEKVISENESYSKFKIRAVSSAYKGAGELHEESKQIIGFKDAYLRYNSPISFLEYLKGMNLPKSDLYKYFCKVTYKVYNQYDKPVSGGEMAEFNLLKALQDARQFELLLIDEPESSFDNLFLKNSVNKSIKDISKEMPVVVVTHNSTVGMLLNPDYVFYTQRKITDGRDTYKLYFGSPGDKHFKTTTGEEILSHDVIMSSLEAGADAYSSKGRLYSNYIKI